jgi:hypothetical protein
MNWYQENRWLGNFLIALAAALLICVWLLFYAKAAFSDAQNDFNGAANERARLEHLNPFPNDANFRKTESELDQYRAALDKVKEELRAQVLPLGQMAPSEFQTRLRQTIADINEKARANRVKLPDNFHLGFDEFTSALPSSAASAATLSQELAQIEMLLGILIDARVDGIATLTRGAAPPENPAVAALPRKAGAVAERQLIERAVVDLSFTASPSALRKVLNQIASSDRQFFVVRTLYVRNEQLKGPSREGSPAAAVSATTGTGNTSAAGLKFIVGNEHLQSTARIEMLRFNF